MSSRRTLILIGAIAIGALAAFALLNYVRGVEEDAKPNPVSVYVVSAPIKRGTAYADAQSLIKRKTISAEFRPDTFVEDLKSLENKVAVTDLAANQVLVKDMFVNADVASTSFRERLSGENVAIALPIDGVRAVGGLLQPGDDVNILVTVGGSTNGAAAAPPAGGAAATVNPQSTPYGKTARYYYQKVRILSIGTQVAPLPGEAVKESTTQSTTAAATSSGSIVFEVPAAVAQRLAALDPGSIYLTLVPENWNPRALGPISADELKGLVLPGEDANQLTPYGPTGFTPAAGKGN